MSGKIPIFCSLLPVELFVNRGFEAVYLTSDELLTVPRLEYHCAFHENICSYSKALYEYLMAKKGEFSFIIVPTSCDAMKKLYTALSEKIDANKLFLLDFPKNRNASAVKFYASVLEKLDKFICQ